MISYDEKKEGVFIKGFEKEEDYIVSKKELKSNESKDIKGKK